MAEKEMRAVGISAATDDPNTLKIHFDGPVTDEHRAALLDAINAPIDNAKCERLEKVIENVAWMLNGDLTEEALKNLKAYVSRNRATLTEEPSHE